MAEITREDIMEGMETAQGDIQCTYQDQTVIAASAMVGTLLIDIRERLDKIIDHQAPRVNISGEGFSIHKGAKTK